MEQEIEQLKSRISYLETMIAGSPQFEELIRNIIFFDVDNTTALTHTVGGISVPLTPTKYLKIYFRGQHFEVAVF